MHDYYCSSLSETKPAQGGARSGGYNEAEGYAASLRQQAELMNDPEELLFAAACIERQASRINVLETVINEEVDACDCADAVNRMVVENIRETRRKT